MSLTSFIMEKDVRTKLREVFPSPRIQLEQRSVIEPLTNHCTLVGTAFDSLLRFSLQRLHTHAVVKPWIAELAAIQQYSALAGIYGEARAEQAVDIVEEAVALGYTDSLRAIERIVAQFHPHGAKPVTKQTATLARSAPSPRNTALMIVRPAKKRTKDQTLFIDQLCKSDATVATAYTLAQAFGSLLRNLEGKTGLEKWEAAVRVSGIPELIDFMEGLADDAEAVENGCTESWNNGMVEGFVNKVKWLKRSGYGRARFPLLQRRVLLHPTSEKC